LIPASFVYGKDLHIKGDKEGPSIEELHPRTDISRNNNIYGINNLFVHGAIHGTKVTVNNTSIDNMDLRGYTGDNGSNESQTSVVVKDSI
jgi:hypothetical protein